MTIASPTPHIIGKTTLVMKVMELVCLQYPNLVVSGYRPTLCSTLMDVYTPNGGCTLLGKAPLWATSLEMIRNVYGLPALKGAAGWGVDFAG